LKFIPHILLLLILTSCGATEEVEDAVTYDVPEILGDKWIEYNEDDEYGLYSPDKVYFLGLFDDSLVAHARLTELGGAELPMLMATTMFSLWTLPKKSMSSKQKRRMKWLVRLRGL